MFTRRKFITTSGVAFAGGAIALANAQASQDRSATIPRQQKSYSRSLPAHEGLAPGQPGRD